MQNNLFFTAVIFSVTLVSLILISGLFSFGIGGKFNKKYGNTLMRLRILLQFLAVILLLLLISNDGQR